MKNDKKKVFIIIAILAFIVGFYFYNNGTFSDRGNNGWWNSETQQCWSSPNDPQGGTLPSYVCCFNAEGYQTNCNTGKKLSSAPVTFAIFRSGASDVPNQYKLSFSVGVTNTANTPFTKVWIEPASAFTSNPVYAPGNTAANNYLSTIEGYSNAGVINNLAAGATGYLNPTGFIDLQSLSPNKLTKVAYTGALNITANYLAGATSANISQVSNIQFNVTKEEVGFTVNVALSPSA